MGVPVCLDRQKNHMVCMPGKEPELCDRWIVPGRQSLQISRHINQAEVAADPTKRKRTELANVRGGGGAVAMGK